MPNQLNISPKGELTEIDLLKIKLTKANAQT